MPSGPLFLVLSQVLNRLDASLTTKVFEGYCENIFGAVPDNRD
jgi:hypothetical protein